jgi:hypothetical protein
MIGHTSDKWLSQAVFCGLKMSCILLGVNRYLEKASK